MYCRKCGKQIPDDSLFCHHCGAKQEPVEKIEEAPAAAAQELSGIGEIPGALQTSEILDAAAGVAEAAAETANAAGAASSAGSAADAARAADSAEISRAAGPGMTPESTIIDSAKSLFNSAIKEASDTVSDIEDSVSSAEQKLSSVLTKIEDKAEQSFSEADKREEAELQSAAGNNSFAANASLDMETGNLILKIAAAIFGAFAAYRGINLALSMLRYVFSIFGYRNPFNIIMLELALGVRLMGFLLLTAAFLAFAFKRKPTQSAELLGAVVLSSIMMIPIQLVSKLIYSHIRFDYVAILVSMAGCAILFTFLYLMGNKSILGFDYSNPKIVLLDCLNALLDAVIPSGGKAERSAAQPETAKTAPAAAPKPAAYASSEKTHSRRLDDSRSLLKYFFFTLLTCGLYSYYFIYSIARDVNEICEGDDEKTGGLLAFILLSALTCGFYAIYWEYKLGNRLQMNAPRYGKTFTENGTSILLWTLFGAFICGIGPWIAMNIIIRNTNILAREYNAMYGLA